jgi:alcohol-forming fatty acyl-CoA reductase
MFTEYYKGKSILITGTTGFVGKVILEKVLRTFPVIDTIYISIKSSGNLGKAYDRYKHEIKDSQIFDALKQ